MAFIEPTGQQLKELSQMKHEGPIVMVNLLKLKKEGGQESYAKYSDATLKLVQKIGGRVIYFGKYMMPVIGDGDWDGVLLVEYPSIEAFFEMVNSPEYKATVHHRSEALEDSRLWATKPVA
ncbi:Uncharacterized conserved protein, DUF1330 family [Desulfatibacillum alkenivorans DSM 16219]|jgi:uncharacterized protein (DUF1330 family)|uniref:Uncharacterized conserved protein, DUF1330 family n=1 Tax=Desulfatibacillum alkenivorans DSM 16219 TaxID=1121393 RepID=A0A1M6J7P2_9BACT|nr:DUF1330 domain-containing protein [Desulfatibacillum alkenivorans]SHJ42665.1 Uncharacterized conserved protein, DUF1330 family [Desulfatibacillum alkenivorans DSM 16219]